MPGKKSIQQLGTILVALLLGVGSSSLLNSEAEAKSEFINPQRLIAEKSGKNSDEFQPPGRGAPPNTAEGGARGPCLKNKELKALTPDNYLALTVSEHPTFFVYVPEYNQEFTQVQLKFILIDETQEDEKTGGLKSIYEKVWPAPDSQQSGIVRVDLPAGSLPPLDVGKTYHWFFQMVCDPDDLSEDGDKSGIASVEGWIERTEPSYALMNQLKNAAPSDRPSVYARAGIWHEALTTLADLRRNNPEDIAIKARWQKLLTSVGLGEFSEEPLIESSHISQERSNTVE